MPVGVYIIYTLHMHQTDVIFIRVFFQFCVMIYSVSLALCCVLHHMNVSVIFTNTHTNAHRKRGRQNVHTTKALVHVFLFECWISCFVFLSFFVVTHQLKTHEMRREKNRHKDRERTIDESLNSTIRNNNNNYNYTANNSNRMKSLPDFYVMCALSVYSQELCSFSSLFPSFFVFDVFTVLCVCVYIYSHSGCMSVQHARVHYISVFFF